MSLTYAGAAPGAPEISLDRREGGETLNGLLLRTLLSSAPVGIAFYDRELRCLRINDVLAELDGLSAAAYVGRPLDDTVPGLRDAARGALRRVLETGEAVVGVEVRGATPARPDEERTWLATYYPVRDGRRGGDVVALGAVVVDITERKRAEAERERLVSDLRDAAERQRQVTREMLFAASGGRLRLCSAEEDLPPALPEATDPIPLSVASLRHLRKDVREAGERLGLTDARRLDAETAAGEAAMNAVTHARGGHARVCAAPAGPGGDVLQVWVRDKGPGIPEAVLHRATLERGFTTSGTLGQGFWVMLQTADRTYLYTGPAGTTVVLEQHRTAPPPPWLEGV